MLGHQQGQTKLELNIMITGHKRGEKFGQDPSLTDLDKINLPLLTLRWIGNFVCSPLAPPSTDALYCPFLFPSTLSTYLSFNCGHCHNVIPFTFFAPLMRCPSCPIASSGNETSSSAAVETSVYDYSALREAERGREGRVWWCIGALVENQLLQGIKQFLTTSML